MYSRAERNTNKPFTFLKTLPKLPLLLLLNLLSVRRSQSYIWVACRKQKQRCSRLFRKIFKIRRQLLTLLYWMLYLEKIPKVSRRKLDRCLLYSHVYRELRAFASSLKTAAPNHLFLADLQEKSALFDQAATKYSAKVAGWMWLSLMLKEQGKTQQNLSSSYNEQACK